MISDIVVECYSGHTYAQEPRAFLFDPRRSDGGTEYQHRRRTVTMVHRRWREPTGPCFEVLADDAHAYVLAYHETTDRWSLLVKANHATPKRDGVPGESCSCLDLRQITLSEEDGQ